MPPSGGIPFGKYELLDRIAAGGMAEIYRANYLAAAGITKPVVIKKILPAYAGNRGFIQMFMDEARIVVGLSHGNIAQVFDFGEIDGEFYLAMELVHGQPLSVILRRAQEHDLAVFPTTFAVFIALEMCKGLHYAHTRVDAQGNPLKIVHRDVSPQNVLIGYDGQVKLVDFGIARARSAHRDKTEAGAIKGKYVYFAPEQARGRDFDARTDVFAVGTVLYEMLCGRLPFQGKMMEVLSRIVRGDFPRPRTVNPALPPALERILLTAMAKEKSDRYPTAQAMQEALAGYLYAHAPTFSNAALAQMMSWLFEKEVAVEGNTVQLPASFVDQIPAWRKAKGPLPVSDPGRARPPPLPAKDDEQTPVADDEPTPASERVTFAEPSSRRSPSANQRARRDRRPPTGVDDQRVPFDTADGYRKAPRLRSSKLLLATVPLLAAAVAAGAVFAWGNFTSYSVRVQSTPPGAQVSVDGAPSGQVTPVLIKGLSADRSHVIELSLSGMKPWRHSLPPARGVTIPLVATLTPVTPSEPTDPRNADPGVSADGTTAAKTGTSTATLNLRQHGVLIAPSRAARIRLDPKRKYRIWAETAESVQPIFYVAETLRSGQGPYPASGQLGSSAKDADVVHGATALYAFVVDERRGAGADPASTTSLKVRLQAEGVSEISTLFVQPQLHAVVPRGPERVTLEGLDPAITYDVTWRTPSTKAAPTRLLHLQEASDGTIRAQMLEPGRPEQVAGAHRVHFSVVDDSLEDNGGEVQIDLTPRTRSDAVP